VRLAVDFLLALLDALRSAAEATGGWLVRVIEAILPAGVPRDLVLPMGWLALLTAGLLLAEAGRKLVWVVVAVGWLLVLARIALEVARAWTSAPA
jgi:hypothetical protein